ncbi:MAG: LamG domain-containing protein [Candidatus Pacearchaeota archaeon]|nr:LamG domain-containing protein [Candidatus Pacearchaeota archaeon]
MLNKKGKSLIAFGILLICIALLSLSFIIKDNSVMSLNTVALNYGAEQSKITFTSENKAIAKAELLVPVDKVNYVEVGKDRIVFSFNIESLEDYTNAIGDVKILNMKTGKEEAKTYEIVYAVYGDVSVNDYDTVCKDVYNEVNKTTDNVCKREAIGSHKERQIVEWKELTDKTLLKGNITIGIMTDVEEGDYYDGIPILYGKEISRWVTWEAIVKDVIEDYYGTSESGLGIDDTGMWVQSNSTNWRLVAFNISDKSQGTHCYAFSNGTPVEGTLEANKTCSFYSSLPIFYKYSEVYLFVNVTSGEVKQVRQEVTSTFINFSYMMTIHSTGGGANSTTNMMTIETMWTQRESLDETPPTATTPTITPSNPTIANNLQCYATLTDNLQTSLTAYWTWYKDDVSYLSGNTSVSNGINSLITTLDSGNTAKGEDWKCEVKPYDGGNYGDAKNSSIVTILNTIPTQSNPSLSTPSGKNLNNEDLTCYNQSTYDADGDAVTNVYNWYKNNQPLTVLNMPLEIDANDYSGKDNDGTVYGASFADGKVGKALSFDGINDYVDIKDINEAEGTNSLTIEAWVKPETRATGVVHPMILAKYYAWNLYINGNNNGFAFSFNDGGGWVTDTLSYSATLSTDTWYHVAVRYDGSTCKIFVDGNEVASGTCNGNIITNTNKVKIGQWDGNEWFNGSIDEAKIYPYTLSPEQIKQNYEETKDGLTSSSKIVSQETTGGDAYMCQVTPNDAEDDGTTLNSSTAEIKWAIMFDVRSGEDNSSLTSFNINCNNSFSASGVSSPYTAGFLPGSYECTFSKLDYYDKIQVFVAEGDKIVNVKLSYEKQLTIEEHKWLEAIYNCLFSGDCSLYNLLLEMNQTIGKIWEQTKPTDETVVVFENVTNKIVDSSNNLTIDYAVDIPIKAGYSLGAYLPVRIGFWFLDENNETCYNQGDKPTEVEEPYCQPLITEVVGPMGGQVNFTVELKPNLPSGDYSIKRIIDIDPNNVWINYGQELISKFTMVEGLANYGISVEKTGEVIPKKEGLLQNIKSGITGAITGISNFVLSGGQIVAIVAIIGGVLVVFIISKTIIKLNKR